jgi:hypothetical protein
MLIIMSRVLGKTRLTSPCGCLVHESPLNEETDFNSDEIRRY